MKPIYSDKFLTVHLGSCLDVLRELPDESMQCCVTSPPYWGLRDYGVEGQIGLEQTPQEYVSTMVSVFQEVRRVLRNDGTLWINLGDTYNGYMANQRATSISASNQHSRPVFEKGHGLRCDLKSKDLVGIPWRVAFALQDDGWYLRSDIIWCLSGGTWVYARTKKGDMPVMVRDLARLKSGTVRLWNGEKWTQLLGMSKSPRRGNEIEILLRSGERISCTPTHKFPTARGLFDAADLTPGDVLETCRLPEPETAQDCAIDTDAAWLAGLYIAEGSMSGDTIQIAGHAKERDRWARVQMIAEKFGGSATRTVNGNCCNIRIYGRVLVALLRELVSGRTAKDKCFAPVVWRYSNAFVSSMLDGYLSGDGHFDAKNNRWRLGFTRNYNIERDLRVACARLGYRLTLKPSTVLYNGGRNPSFRGEIRMSRSGYRTERNPAEIVEIRNARCREVYDLGVADEPHVFALASGVLTHNSKPNPMPESVTDRPTKAHEYIFLLSKSERYFYDAEAIGEPIKCIDRYKRAVRNGESFDPDRHKNGDSNLHNSPMEVLTRAAQGLIDKGYTNKRTVWTVPTNSYKDAHFATYPPDLIKPCILAGSKPGDVVLDPFFGAGTTGLVALELGRRCIGIELNPDYATMAINRCNVTPGLQLT